MKEKLPLFPLNTVLYPGMPIKLNIFEERYKQMIDFCVTQHSPFGVVLIKKGRAELGPLAEPYDVGCTADITKLNHSDDGNILITAVGRERFRIHELNYDQPYLRGDVELFPIQNTDLFQHNQQDRILRKLVARYLELLKQASRVQFDTGKLPKDPLVLAFLASVIVKTGNEQKQSLLEAESADDLLHRLCDLYRYEVTMLNILLSEPEDGLTNASFSLN